ncbi:hypothetical protein R1flu_020598 [Riccia fluitans]|uniref:Uncharacterized protein n=1 Tax=Riccia fluitans TaxID=41844 RepID=A0ABD1ZLY8_9MARC
MVLAWRFTIRVQGKCGGNNHWPGSPPSSMFCRPMPTPVSGLGQIVTLARVIWELSQGNPVEDTGRVATDWRFRKVDGMIQFAGRAARLMIILVGSSAVATSALSVHSSGSRPPLFDQVIISGPSILPRGLPGQLLHVLNSRCQAVSARLSGSFRYNVLPHMPFHLLCLLWPRTFHSISLLRMLTRGLSSTSDVGCFRVVSRQGLARFDCHVSSPDRSTPSVFAGLAASRGVPSVMIGWPSADSSASFPPHVVRRPQHGSLRTWIRNYVGCVIPVNPVTGRQSVRLEKDK